MKVISTVHKAGFDLYGDKWVKGVDLWPENAEFHLYTEGFDIPPHPRITGHRIEELPRRQAFMAKYAHYKSPGWRWNVTKWANKVFATHDALYEHLGLAVWCDCDVETYVAFPEGYIEKMLPDRYYLAAFKRQGMCTETGFWVMNCLDPEHKEFLDTWIAWLETGQFTQLLQWCDASTLDATIRRFEAQGKRIITRSLSGPHEKKMHPMAFVDIAKYVDHRKGDTKDDPGKVSEDNIFRKAA